VSCCVTSSQAPHSARTTYPTPLREGLKDTPARFARAMVELTTPVEFIPTVFVEEGADEMVVCLDIAFYSLCEHHLLPFFGVAHIGYVPKNSRIIGLSKIARTVEMFSRRLQVQESMTINIADFLEEHLKPLGVGVVLEAEHLCMTMRGVRKPGATTRTSCLRGYFKDDPDTRSEFLSLVTGR